MRRTLWVILLCMSCAACGPRYAHLPPEPPARFQVAEKYLRAGEHEKAAETFRLFLSQTSDPTFRARAYYDLAQAEFALGEPRQTLETLSALYAEFPNEVWGQVSALRGDAQEALGNRVEAFLAWEEAWALSPAPDRQIIESRMEAAVPELNDSELLELSELITVPNVYALIAARVPPEQGAIASARAAGKEQLAPIEAEAPTAAPETGEGVVAEAAPSAAAGEELAAVHHAELVPAPPAPAAWPAAKVACLLPLTGPDDTYGARALSGLRLAFDDQPELLAVRDTGGDPAVAAQLFDELVATPSILAVIGPLRSNVAARVAPKANDAELPLLSLAQSEGAGGSFVFPISVTREQQVRALVGYATDELKARRFGVVYPNDGYGREFKSLFESAVRKHGAQIVGSLAYVPGQSDFAGEAATVRAWARDRQLDAVFIPDGARRATKLAADIRLTSPRLVLLGTESWNRPGIIAQTGNLLDGAVFSDAFFAGSTEPSIRTFVQRFQQKTGRLPTAFEAQAFDAGLLARQALASGATTRAEVVGQLFAMGRFVGAGRLLATGHGFERELFLLHVEDGKIEEVLPAPPWIGKTSG